MPSIEDIQITKVSVDEVRRDLLLFLRRIEKGESLVITKEGKPVAEVKPITSTVKKSRPYGLCAGQFSVPDGFDDPLPQSVTATFEER